MPYDQSFSGQAALRHVLNEKLGLHVNKPDSVGLWLVHNGAFAPEPYFVIVRDVSGELYWDCGQAKNLYLDATWPTKEYPELDIACWKLL